MKHSKENISSLQRLSDTIELLDNSSKQLMSLMEDQVDAIIASDTQKIESLTDVHTSLSWHYKKNEKEFIKDLSKLLEEVSGGKDQSIRLLNLKTYFPSCEDEINSWHKALSENAKKLKQKHNQVIELLEFAMKQNARMMHSMYSQHNEKNTRYISNGSRSDIATGVAVNQEI
jgi:hypothetical protein